MGQVQSASTEESKSNHASQVYKATIVTLVQVCEND